ncbi:hypothetical protein L0P88_03970 [Muricauda sp. SCSIO 64092]|uniref:hypothetical protein n=1 Tax=Allomuricauda sp. SCSIO 64092 TaxID=2908842 RepID=UPI001FF65B8F|nr:hypothetical protein [Muricauda sp. SCSIO 64092]UOY07711.1 hypothetical protein L0P88_03970 [Muricauda sp. SCSIO 64092]
MKFINAIYWFLYRLTPAGKTAWILKSGFNGLKERARDRRKTKLKVVHSAKKLADQKKILGFGKKGSVTKSKKSDHQIIEGVKKEHAEELSDKGIKISRSGKFKNA